MPRLQQREYADAQVARWRSRGLGVMSPPDPYYPERRHWPMRNWLMEIKETIRYLREINLSGDPERPWVANFRGECLCLPVVSDHQARQVDFNILWLEDGSRDYISVIAILQTMLSDAGFAFVNLLPSWGQSLRSEFFKARDVRFMSDAMFLRQLLANSQDAWDQIARGRKFSVRREDVPSQTLDPEAAGAFPVEDDGDALMLTSEEQELLGMAVVTRLRLAQQPPGRRGSLDALMSIPSWPGSNEGARVWGAPLPEVVCSSSVASGDAPMLTPDENMSSAGGSSQGSPGFGPAGVTASVFVATTAADGGTAPMLEQQTVYVPVAAYPPDFAQAPSPGSTAPPLAGPRDQVLHEETKRKSRERRHTTVPSGNSSKSSQRKREIEESRHKEAADTEIATLRLRLHQLKEQQARERDDIQQQLIRQSLRSETLRSGKQKPSPGTPSACVMRRSPGRKLQPNASNKRRSVRKRNSTTVLKRSTPEGRWTKNASTVSKKRSDSSESCSQRRTDHAGEARLQDAAGGYPGSAQGPGYGMMSFRPFIAYDAVEPFDPILPLDKRRLWWDKFQYIALMGGWREQERCTGLYSRLSHNEGTKAWVQQLPAVIRHNWNSLSDKFANEFCRSTESPVERYLRQKQDSRETPRTFLWRLNAAASLSGCRRHLNQFLKNLRDRELQLSLQGRIYSSVDELEETLRQVKEMERGLRRRPGNDVQFGRYKPPGVSSGAAPRTARAAKVSAAYLATAPKEEEVTSSRQLQWDDDMDSDYGYQYSSQCEVGLKRKQLRAARIARLGFFCRDAGRIEAAKAVERLKKMTRKQIGAYGFTDMLGLGEEGNVVKIKDKEKCSTADDVGPANSNRQRVQQAQTCATRRDGAGEEGQRREGAAYRGQGPQGQGREEDREEEKQQEGIDRPSSGLTKNCTAQPDADDARADLGCFLN
ncbi:hypothetical protein PHYSODRAFT_246575 [Phytophthora sojae]|uniref:Retrotransposon gag domain-containing protein n=1 Tax=Phytophthora sojae (strain P6497) TaxID=1094619 RepID=G5ADJ4_PHYSP|nr:hypothetical protein PHYSODRAFT_246575 [Phytophthora sojae]EGZ06247.1 hypothetical protein PHYSODRAFT_246575 [Phytophthora sojae]|eukprot:XP_009538144.1 hypothetical protein PHYSODRAFT_246575 [Phytophthora sojae]